MLLVYGAVLKEPARKRLFLEAWVGHGRDLLDGLPAEIDPDGAVYGHTDEPGGAVVGCRVIEVSRADGFPSPLPLAKLEGQLRGELKDAKRRWKGLAAWVEEKGKGKVKLGEPGLVLVLED